MSIQRAIVKSTFFGTVQARNMYTAEVTEVGGDTASLLWHTYLDQLHSTLITVLSNGFTVYASELQEFSAGHWVPFEEDAESWSGTHTVDPLPNAVSYVLIGKAAGLRKIGRKFFGPIPESSNIGNVVAETVMVTLAEALLYYISPVTGIGGGTLQPGVVDSFGIFHPFVGGLVSSLLGSMRRRKPGIGM